MTIAIFGASGKTGMQVVQQALEQGYGVTAFVRTPEKMTIQHDRLKLVQGDVTNPDAVDQAVAGADAVIVALGSKPDGTDIVMEEGTTNIINAMNRHKVQRIIVMSSYPMSGSPEGIAFLKSMGMDDGQIAAVKPVLDDKTKQEQAVRESGLSWTIVWPLMLTDGAKTGQYRANEKLDVKSGDTISRADVADFMLKAITDPETERKTITISI